MNDLKKTAKLRFHLDQAQQLVPEVLKEMGKPAVEMMTAHLGACKPIIVELETDGK